LFVFLAKERMFFVDYALTYPNPRHRELIWRMVDQGIVCASPPSVYRILDEKGLIPKWRLSDEEQESRSERERAHLPDEVWLIDFTYVWIGKRWWYLIFLMDECSGYIVHWELLWSMDRWTTSAAVERALEIPGRKREPIIQSDNGAVFRSREFKRYLAHRGISQRRIYPHCPEQNGFIERGIRSVKELAGVEFLDNRSAYDEMRKAIEYYNQERRHSNLHYLRPIDYYWGDPLSLLEERREKIARAREERKQINLTSSGFNLIMRKSDKMKVKRLLKLKGQKFSFWVKQYKRFFIWETKKPRRNNE